MRHSHFPQDFIWGCATSAYQIEGAAAADGKTDSIWDTFCRQPGAIQDQTDGQIACDHYHRFEQDIALMKTLGIDHYRFSIAWPRIIPHADGVVNQAGIAFYRRLVDCLKQYEIKPYITLYHWDLPQWMEDQGGWRQREVVARFAEYTQAIVSAFPDVNHWITHNEPWCASMLSHEIGAHAPGIKDLQQALTAAHHILMSHGRAVQVIRQALPQAKIGITLNFEHAVAASQDPLDQDAARQHDGYFNRWFADPVFKGYYPQDMLAYYGENIHFIEQGDMALINQDIDFLGVNYYTRKVCRDSRASLPQEIFPQDSQAQTDIGWDVSSDGFYELLVRLHKDYQPKAIYITENGACYNDEPDHFGQINDQRRIQYLDAHISRMAEALQVGVPVKGYFVWSLMDNFEWAYGYSMRFGIIHVDYQTQVRTAKASAHWYHRLISAG